MGVPGCCWRVVPRPLSLADPSVMLTPHEACDGADVSNKGIEDWVQVQKEAELARQVRQRPQPGDLQVPPIAMALLRTAVRETLGDKATVLDLRREWYPKLSGPLTTQQSAWMVKRWRKLKGL